MIYGRKLLLYIVVVPLSVFVLACGNFNFFDTLTSSDSSDGTVVALQATIDTLQTGQAQPPLQSTVQIIYITPTPLPPTATSTSPPPTPTPLPPSPTPVPPSATPTPVPSNTAAPDTTPQGRTIIIIVTPTSPPTLTPYPEAPIIIAPYEGAIVAKDREILLHWGWNGLLQGPDEYYEVKIRPDGNPRSVYIAQERGLSHNLVARLGGGRYYWTVQIVKGHWINNSGHPDDWVFEGFRGPESAPRLLIVDGNTSSPRSQSQADPPHPRLPYGVAFGSIAFVAFAGLTRFKKQSR